MDIQMEIPYDRASLDKLLGQFGVELFKEQPREPKMPTLKIMMMMHFGCTIRPFPDPWRTSEIYVKYIRQLLDEGMVERPTKKQRRERPGWSYRATKKGRVYLNALTRVPQPIRTNPEWVMPDE